jgi:DMSO/TMAO reductase YedYZ molybdopterin-dependent catalytic subunit
MGASWLRAPKLAWADSPTGSGQLYELTARPANYESTRDTFTTRITPLDRFYLRNHFDIPVGDPATWPTTWKLEVEGVVAKPRTFTLADLHAMKQTTVEAVLQCAGNGRGLFTPHVAGVQWRYGAMGNAEWTGVKLADILAVCGVDKMGQHIAVQGMEKPTLEATPPFVRGIPIAKAMHPDTIVALQMNGKPLSPMHGYPARLVVPGWVADDWIKWLTMIQVRVDEPKGFWYETGYRFPVTPGKPGEAVPADQMKPMTKLFVKSLIGSISDGDVVQPGKRELVGVAFSGEATIKKVDITLDGGSTWTPAKLDGKDSKYGFRVFKYAWDAKPGAYKVGSRATDSTGAVQPESPIWNPSGYLYNAIDIANVEVKA